MNLLTVRATYRVFVFCLLALAGILAVSALATSIASNVTVIFTGLGFGNDNDYGSTAFTGSGFTLTLSDQDWLEVTGVWNSGNQTGACLNNACINSQGIEQQTITITASGSTFNFVSFWDLNFCSPDQTNVVKIQGYLNNSVVVTQTTGFVDDLTCAGTAATVTLSSGFQNVDKVVVTSGSNGFNDDFDQFVFHTAITVPGAPTIGTATAGNGQASLTFAAPASNGASITSYTATSSPGGFTGTGTSSPITVTGLSNGQAYTFTVTATNSVGTGAASGASNAATPATVPGAPTIGTATAGNGQASLTFAAPASNGASITSYTATSSPGGFTGTGSSSPIVVTGLSNGQAYTFTVTATNSVGTGSASSASNLATPATVPSAPTITTVAAGNGQATVTFTAPATNGAAITSYTVTSSPGGFTGTGSSGPIVVTGLSNGQAYTFTVTATNSVGTGAASGASNAATPATVPGAPTIGTATAGNGQASVTFAAPVSNGASITSYTATSSPGGFTGTGTSSPITVTGLSNGQAYTFTVTATNSVGTGSASSASNLVTPATVPSAPTITTVTAGNGQATVTFTAPATNGGAAITGYIATASPGGFAGGGSSSPIMVSGLSNGQPYTFTVTATNSVGIGPASAASNSVTLPTSQTVTFANPGTQNFGASPTFSATATSGLTPAFTSSTTGVCTITSSGALSIITVGTCTINVNQAGNASYLAAPQVSQSFLISAVVPAAPTIGTATAGSNQASLTFTAPTFTGGASITGYMATSNPGGFTGTEASSPITVTGLSNGQAYTFTVTATNSAGTGPASAPSNSVKPAGGQTITFANPGAQNFGTSPTLPATATSGLTPAFTSSTTGVCTTTSLGKLTFLSAGTCTISVNQAGNSSYLAAPPVTRSFSVAAVVPGAPVIGTGTAGSNQASVTFTAPVFTGGATITGFIAKSSPGGLAGGGTSSPVTVSGLNNGQAYTFTVTATNSVGTGPASAASNSVTPATSQTVTFDNPGTQNFGTSPTLTATVSSGLTPVFTSSATGVCTITTGGRLTLLSVGTCAINVNQAGNSRYLAAPEVTRSFSIAAVVPGAPAIGAATAGNAQATVNFTASVFSGGASITDYIATSNPGGLTGTGPSSPITVTGLTNAQAYTFTVTATNSVGTSPLSAASNSVRPQGAAAPQPQPGSISVVSGGGQSEVLGTPFAAALVVLVKDTSGSPLANVQVTFSVVAGSAILSPAAAPTGRDGTAQATANPTAIGPIAISASVAKLSQSAAFTETALPTPAAVELSVLPAALMFTAGQNGDNPVPANIAVSNTGAGTLPWTASASGNPSWIAISAFSGNTPAVMAVSVSTAGLAAGIYTTTISVSSGSQSRTVAVVLTVQTQSPPQFALTPAALVVNALSAATPTAGSINVANTGAGNLAWTAAVGSSTGGGWLTINPPASGTAPSTLSVLLDSSGLAAGQYLGNVVFSAPGVADSSVTVVLNVSTLPNLIAPVPLLNFRGTVGSSFAPQTIPVTTNTGTNVSITASSTVAVGANWLALSGASASTPASIAVSVNASGLAAGYHVGYVSVQGAGARNTLLIPIVLDLGSATAAGTLSVSPGGVLLASVASSSPSAALTRTIMLSSDAQSFSWNAATVTTQGTWLSVSPASGSGNGTVTLIANPAGLQPGGHTAQLFISATGTSNAGLIIPVTLIVSSAVAQVELQNPLQPLQPAGNFVASEGIPIALQASIVSPAGAPVTGASVQVAFSTGDAPVLLTDVGGGTYVGVWTPLQTGPVSLTFASVNASPGVVTGMVITANGKQPALPSNAFVSAASFVSGLPLGVGSISTVFGLNLATLAAASTKLPLPLSLGGTSVKINGTPAPLFYVSPSQINFFVPYELSGQTTGTITISTNSGVVETTGIPIAPQSPGIFILDAAGDAAAIHLDGSIVGSTKPASGGEILEVFATGLGPVSNSPPDGAAPQPGILAVDQIPAAVTIGGVSAQVLFAGLAPGFVGLYQTNVVVPTGLPAGPATIALRVGSLFSNSAIIQLH